MFFTADILTYETFLNKITSFAPPHLSYHIRQAKQSWNDSANCLLQDRIMVYFKITVDDKKLFGRRLSLRYLFNSRSNGLNSSSGLKQLFSLFLRKGFEIS